MPNLNRNKIIRAFKRSETDFKVFDDQVSALKAQLKEKINIKTIEDVRIELEKFKRKIDLQPIIISVNDLESSFKDDAQKLYDEIELKTLQLDKVDKTRIEGLRTEIQDLQYELSTLEEARKKDIQNLRESIPTLSDIEDRLAEFTLELSTRIDGLDEEERLERDWTNEIEKLRREFNTRIGNMHGGGNMNRQIVVNGVDPLLRYTDINLKNGANVTITYQNNDVTKKVDVTISSSGGGGGSSRLIQSIATSQTAGSTAGVDYVYLCSGTLTLTMPTTVGNTNLYTIKNIGAGIVTINTTGGETIDGQLTQVMPLQFTSVDLISNNSGDWAIT